MQKRELIASIFISCSIHSILVYFINPSFKDEPNTKNASTRDLNFIFTKDKNHTNKKNPIINKKDLTVKSAKSSSVNTPFFPQKNESYTPSRYLDSSIVDTRPAPITDWIIDTAVLSGKNFRGLTVQYTIWVSEVGTIDHLEFLNQESIPTEIRYALLSLKDTVMAPATVKDIPVPCVLTLELSFGY